VSLTQSALWKCKLSFSRCARHRLGFQEHLNMQIVEAQGLLGCTAVFLIGCRPTFQRCVLRPLSGDGGSTHLWNVGLHPIKNTAVHPRRLWAMTPPWELEISCSIQTGYRSSHYRLLCYWSVDHWRMTGHVINDIGTVFSGLWPSFAIVRFGHLESNARGLAGRYQRFGGTYCLHLQAWTLVSITSSQGVTMQKTNINILAAVRTYISCTVAVLIRNEGG
jgi:hypothetical protein